MKKTLLAFGLILLMLGTSLTAFAAGEELRFADTDWSEQNPYPDWYGGRYLNDEQVLIYVVVSGFEDEAAPLVGTYVTAPHSYNTLMTTLNTITTELMATQTAEETVCIYSAWLDEINNCIGVGLYSGSERADDMHKLLGQRFGGLVDVAITDDLIATDILKSDIGAITGMGAITEGVVPATGGSLSSQCTGAPRGYDYWFWIVSISAILLVTGALLIREQRKRGRFRLFAFQANGGEFSSTRMGTPEAVYVIKTSTVTPDDAVFEKILGDIED